MKYISANLLFSLVAVATSFFGDAVAMSDAEIEEKVAILSSIETKAALPPNTKKLAKMMQQKPKKKVTKQLGGATNKPNPQADKYWPGFYPEQGVMVNTQLDDYPTEVCFVKLFTPLYCQG